MTYVFAGSDVYICDDVYIFNDVYICNDLYCHDERGGIVVRVHDSCAEGLRLEPDSMP